MTRLFILICLLMTLSVTAQIAPNKYFVAFTDKNGTPYSISNPQAFLTQRAIDRRTAQGIQVVENDLPVNPSYIQQVQNLGVFTLNPTKWLNGVTLYAWDTNVMSAIRALPFVQKVYRCEGQDPINPLPDNKFRMEDRAVAGLAPIPVKSSALSSSAYNYGMSYTQIHQVKGDALHNLGFRGEGKVIAVLDAGFQNANIIAAFDSLRANNQILGTKDFVIAGNNVYNEHWHGCAVLSVIAGNIPGVLVGTAPKADFWLLRSEDANTENIIEEYNWVSAAEYADSVGADVINSSLGYTTFDDPRYNHTCADMDGHSTPVTIGANMAASKGIAVINSAGNEGGSSWTCVSAPSDGDYVMSIAAVDSNGFRAGFSSVGVDTAGRVKPNVAAMGAQTVVAFPDGNIGRSNGTSFSSPLIAGCVTCLWQSHPYVTNFDVYTAMQRSASQFTNPDSLLGYGIPNFSNAFNIISTGPEHTIQQSIKASPNPFTDKLNITMDCETGEAITFTLLDLTGRPVAERQAAAVKGSNVFALEQLSDLRQGIYLLKVGGLHPSATIKVVKL